MWICFVPVSNCMYSGILWTRDMVDIESLSISPSSLSSFILVHFIRLHNNLLSILCFNLEYYIYYYCDLGLCCYNFDFDILNNLTLILALSFWISIYLFDLTDCTEFRNIGLVGGYGNCWWYWKFICTILLLHYCHWDISICINLLN